DVGDMHAEPEMSVRQLLDGDRIVEIARVLTVYGDGGHTSEIRAAFDVALFHRHAKSSRLGDRLFAVGIGNVELANDDLRVNAGLVDAAEHFDHAADRPARRARPAGDLDDHHVARLR